MAETKDNTESIPALPKPKAKQNAIVYNGRRGYCVSLEGKANGGGDLLMEKNVPVKMGDKPTDVVSAEYAAELVNAGICEFTTVTEGESLPTEPPVVVAA